MQGSSILLIWHLISSPRSNLLSSGQKTMSVPTLSVQPHWVSNPREKHPYHMYEMLTMQPDAIRRVLKEEASMVKTIIGAFEEHSLERIHFVGRKGPD